MIEMEKNTVEELAIFSGHRLFDNPRSIGQLSAASVDEYLELLRVAYEARILTNNGVLVRQLEVKLCEYHGVTNCIAVANAALGLTMLAQVFANGKAGEVIMPAFSFRGLPHFAGWAGQVPRFCDVDPVTHCLDPARVESAINDRTTSILSVCNFNSPGFIDELSALGDRYHIPVFLDSVYGLGCSYKGVMLGRFGRAEVYSTHATKLLNGFEGGYITTDDDDLAEILRWQRNFAFPGLRPVALEESQYVLGMNAKLNELHAAMALASLERLDKTIAGNRLRYQAYCDVFGTIAGLTILSCGDVRGEKRNYEMVLVEFGEGWPLTRDEMLTILKAEGCAIGPYYSPPLHRTSHGSPDQTLPVAEDLAQRFLQLPSGEQMSVEDVKVLGDLFRFLGRHGKSISTRLQSAGSTA